MTDTPIPLVDIKARIRSVEREIHSGFERVLGSGRLILGPEVEELEREIAELCGVSHGVGLSSGTDALLAAMMALGVGPGDEVVTTPLSFFASVGAIVRLGGVPVFADIDPKTFNIDPEAAAAKVTPRTKAIEVVHLFGQCAATELLGQAARGVALVEDAAQAIQASRGGQRAGALGTVGCFSFFPTKNLGGLGDGGMAVTDDPDLADALRVLRVHGAKPKYFHAVAGGNMRLDALQAAALRAMVPKLGQWTHARQANADRYDELFGQTGLVASELLIPPWRDPKGEHVFNQYVVRTTKRDGLRDHLRAHGIGCEVYYPLALHLQPCLADLGHREGDFPEAERATREGLAIPIYPELETSQQERVVGEVVRYLGRQ